MTADRQAMFQQSAQALQGGIREGSRVVVT